MSDECTRTIDVRAVRSFRRLLDGEPVSFEQLFRISRSDDDRLRLLWDQPLKSRADLAMTWPDVEDWIAARNALGPDDPPEAAVPVEPGPGDDRDIAPATPPDSSNDRRPTVAITPDEHVVIEAVAQALAADPLIAYQGPRLVRVAGEGWPSWGAFAGGVGPRVEGLPPSSIRTAITRVVRLVRERENGSDPVHPPAWLTKAIWTRGRWDDLPDARPLLAGVEAPAATIDALREEDERTARESALIAGWADIPDPDERGDTIAERLGCPSAPPRQAGLAPRRGAPLADEPEDLVRSNRAAQAGHRARPARGEPPGDALAALMRYPDERAIEATSLADLDLVP